MSTSNSDSPPGPLTPAQLDQFHRDGYLCLPNFFDPSEPLSRARDLVRNFSLEGHPLTKFTTEDSQGANHVGDDYFLTSGDKVRYFLEEEAVGEDGTLVCEKERAVNKVGHGLHMHDDVFHAFSFSPRLQALAKSLNYHRDPRVLQSMIICKQPSIGGAVPHHNDSTFLYTRPASAIGFWFALEDCKKSNGCLSFLKGSHRRPKHEHEHRHTTQANGVEHSQQQQQPPLEADPSHSEKYGAPRGINKRFVRNSGSGGTTFQQLSTDEEAAWSEEDATIEECPAGTLVLIHGSVLHQSKRNNSQDSRYIYTFHMIEGDESRAEYDELNWLQPTDRKEGFSRLYDPPPAPVRAAS